MGWRWAWGSVLGLAGCTVLNPAFGESTTGDDSQASTTKHASTSVDSDAGSTERRDSVSGTSSTGHASASQSGTSSTDPSAGESGSESSGSTGSPTGVTLVVFEGPVVAGHFAQGLPDDTWDVAADLCAERLMLQQAPQCAFDSEVLPILRATPYETLSTASYPPAWKTAPVQGPNGVLVAESLAHMLSVESTLLSSLFDAGLGLDAPMFWSGGYEASNEYPDCEDWRDTSVMGLAGSFESDGSLWFVAGEQPCETTAALLCLCRNFGDG